jgi:uncharacterized protein YjcR
MAKAKKKTNRKPGAQSGNKNALKHGFYSEQFKADEKKRLENEDMLSVESEIALINVFMDRLSKLLDTVELSDDHMKALNTLSNMMASKSTMIRTHYLTRGRTVDVADTILKALEELRLEMGL